MVYTTELSEFSHVFCSNLVCIHSLWRTRFNAVSIHVRYLVDKVVVGWGFLYLLGLFLSLSF